MPGRFLSLTVLISLVVGGLGVGKTGAVTAQRRPPDEFSCTAFPADLSEAILIQRFGTGVKRALVAGSDDGPQEGAVVFEGTPRQLDIVWFDARARTRLAWVRSRELDSPWRTRDGISMGMDLLDMERRNGRPFRLRGLTGPEGLGLVISWGQGRLRALDDNGCRVEISLQPSGERRSDPAISRQVNRGHFSSGHPAMQAINPRVAALSVVHNPLLNTQE